MAEGLDAGEAAVDREDATRAWDGQSVVSASTQSTRSGHRLDSPFCLRSLSMLRPSESRDNAACLSPRIPLHRDEEKELFHQTLTADYNDGTMSEADSSVSVSLLKTRGPPSCAGVSLVQPQSGSALPAPSHVSLARGSCGMSVAPCRRTGANSPGEACAGSERAVRRRGDDPGQADGPSNFRRRLAHLSRELLTWEIQSHEKKMKYLEDFEELYKDTRNASADGLFIPREDFLKEMKEALTRLPEKHTAEQKDLDGRLRASRLSKGEKRRLKVQLHLMVARHRRLPGLFQFHKELKAMVDVVAGTGISHDVLNGVENLELSSSLGQTQDLLTRMEEEFPLTQSSQVSTVFEMTPRESELTTKDDSTFVNYEKDQETQEDINKENNVVAALPSSASVRLSADSNNSCKRERRELHRAQGNASQTGGGTVASHSSDVTDRAVLSMEGPAVDGGRDSQESIGTHGVLTQMQFTITSSQSSDSTTLDLFQSQSSLSQTQNPESKTSAPKSHNTSRSQRLQSKQTAGKKSSNVDTKRPALASAASSLKGLHMGFQGSQQTQASELLLSGGGTLINKIVTACPQDNARLTDVARRDRAKESISCNGIDGSSNRALVVPSEGTAGQLDGHPLSKHHTYRAAGEQIVNDSTQCSPGQSVDDLPALNQVNEDACVDEVPGENGTVFHSLTPSASGDEVQCTRHDDDEGFEEDTPSQSIFSHSRLASNGQIITLSGENLSSKRKCPPSDTDKSKKRKISVRENDVEQMPDLNTRDISPNDFDSENLSTRCFNDSGSENSDVVIMKVDPQRIANPSTRLSDLPSTSLAEAPATNFKAGGEVQKTPKVVSSSILKHAFISGQQAPLTTTYLVKVAKATSQSFKSPVPVSAATVSSEKDHGKTSRTQCSSGSITQTVSAAPPQVSSTCKPNRVQSTATLQQNIQPHALIAVRSRAEQAHQVIVVGTPQFVPQGQFEASNRQTQRVVGMYSKSTVATSQPSKPLVCLASIPTQRTAAVSSTREGASNPQLPSSQASPHCQPTTRTLLPGQGLPPASSLSTIHLPPPDRTQSLSQCLPPSSTRPSSPSSSMGSSGLFPVRSSQILKSYRKGAQPEQSTVPSQTSAAATGRPPLPPQTPGLQTNTSQTQNAKDREVSTKNPSGRQRHLNVKTLMNRGLLVPGKDVLWLEHKGSVHRASLLPSGLVQGNNGRLHATPYQWLTEITGGAGGPGKRTPASQKIFVGDKSLATLSNECYQPTPGLQESQSKDPILSAADTSGWEFDPDKQSTPESLSDLLTTGIVSSPVLGHLQPWDPRSLGTADTSAAVRVSAAANASCSKEGRGLPVLSTVVLIDDRELLPKSSPTDLPAAVLGRLSLRETEAIDRW